MNIFATSISPVTSADWIDDVRKNKMILESAQMLSTAMRGLTLDPNLNVYKSTHINHPCTQWTARSRGNFGWLIKHMEHMCKSFPTHKSSALLPTFKEYESNGWFPFDEPTPFANCTEFKQEEDTTLAYRMQMCKKWKTDTIRVSWNKGTKPDWYANGTL